MDTEVIFWDQSGQPAFFLVNDWLLDLEGTPVGFLERDGAVYSLDGRHVAWYTGGIIRDCAGFCIAYADVVEDHFHPPLPPRRSPPDPPLQNRTVLHPLAAIPTLPPMPRSSWSSLRPEEIFV